MQDTEYQQSEQDEQAKQRLQVLVGRLQNMANDRVQKRELIEKRWLEDLNQWNGEYGEDVKIPKGRSRVFVNLTRRKSNFAEGRLGEMLLPTDDRNYAIKSTPVPDVPGVPKPNLELLSDIAQKKATAMQDEIDDQLAECDYNSVARRMIHDGIVLGTGVIKSPVLRRSVSKRYTINDVMGMKVSKMEIKEEIKPGAEAVSPWHFFPEESANKVEQAENVLERHPMNRKELRDLCKIPGFSHEAVEAILSSDPPDRLTGLFDEAREQQRDGEQQSAGRYEVWEFQGCLPKADATALGIKSKSESGDELDEEPESDAENMRLVVWFCGGHVLKAVKYPYEDGDLPYSVWCWEEDDYSIFGYGLPYRVRHSQRVANAAWRLLMDNAAIVSIPPMVYNDTDIQPVDGDYQLAAGKVFRWVKGMGSDKPPIFPIQIPMQADLLFSIVDRAVQLVEMESGVPDIAQQEGPSPEVGRTATGASLLFNSASAPLRRLVKQFDDRVTKPVIRRMYAWNMQFNEREDIKGDFQIIPQGSSMLLVKEQQQQALLQATQLFAAIPPFAQATDWYALQQQIVQSQNLNASAIMKPQEALQQSQPQEPSPEQIKAQAEAQKLQLEAQRMQLDNELAQAELQLKQGELALKQGELQLKAQEIAGRQQVEQTRAQAEVTKAQAIDADSQRDLQRETLKQAGEQAQREHEERMQLLDISAQQNQTIAETRKEFGLEAIKIDADNQRFNAEIAIKQQQGSGI